MNRLIALSLALLAAAPCFSQADNAPGFRLGLVTDVGGIDDASFNQTVWEGLLRFAAYRGSPSVEPPSYLQSSSQSDYLPNLAAFADQGMDLVVAPGFLFAEAIPAAAAAHPRTRFLIIDEPAYGPNIASVVFKEHEGSFLAGVAAGLRARADGKRVVGFVGGMKFPLIQKFQAGFEQGVRAVLPGARILVEYAAGFADSDEGRRIARGMYDRGAWVIFHAAGWTGNGIIMEAKARAEAGDKRWVIGVDRDQRPDGAYGYGETVILTSMIKRVDVAAYLVAGMAMDGEFPGGRILELGIKEGGVGLPAFNPDLDDAMMAEIDAWAARIASGEIVVAAAPRGN